MVSEENTGNNSYHIKNKGAKIIPQQNIGSIVYNFKGVPVWIIIIITLLFLLVTAIFIVNLTNKSVIYTKFSSKDSTENNNLPSQSKSESNVLTRKAITLPEMIAIPADEYFIGLSQNELNSLVAEGMGSKNDFVYETSQITIIVDSFYISKYEITVSQFKESVKEPNTSFTDSSAKFDDSTKPIVNVTWDEANAYCRWLSNKTGETFRLPYEIEWEIAAKRKTQNRYAWGNDFPDMNNCNFRSSGINSTLAVEATPYNISPFGIYNMSGNVAEWCNDWYHPNHYRLITDQHIRDLPQAKEKVVRGGSWKDIPLYLRCTARMHATPGTKSDAIGFRVVKLINRSGAQ